MTDDQWAELRPLAQAAHEALQAAEFAAMLNRQTFPWTPVEQLVEFRRLQDAYTEAERAYQDARRRIWEGVS